MSAVLRVTRCVSLCALAFGLFSFLLVGRVSAIAADPPTCLGRPATIVGFGIINGTNGPDVIVGSDGDDVIKGRGGDDVICGGLGNDTMDGGAGDDVIDDFDGANFAKGGSGADDVEVTGTADGGSGNDEIVFADETCDGCNDGHALGGSGNDALVASPAGVAEGGSGSDVVTMAAAILAKAETGGARRSADGDAEELKELVDAQGGIGRTRAGDDVETVEIVPFAGVTLDGGSGRDVCIDLGVDTILISCETVE